MDKYPAIIVQKGATAIIDFDLTAFDMQGGSVVFTIRKSGSRACIYEEAMTTSTLHHVQLNDEFTALLDAGASYEWDLMWHLGEERFAQCMPSPLVVQDTVGGYHAGSSLPDKPI